jgi:hypothetical protein
LILKIATLAEFLIGLGKRMTWVSADAQALPSQSQRDDESMKRDGKVAFSLRPTGRR